MALPGLTDTQRVQVGGGTRRPHSVIGLLGPGTGMGVSGLIPADDRWIALGSEGPCARALTRLKATLAGEAHAVRSEFSFLRAGRPSVSVRVDQFVRVLAVSAVPAERGGTWGACWRPDN